MPESLQPGAGLQAGPDRLAYHGVAPLAEGEDALTGQCRINLTFRKAL